MVYIVLEDINKYHPCKITPEIKPLEISSLDSSSFHSKFHHLILRTRTGKNDSIVSTFLQVLKHAEALGKMNVNFIKVEA